LIEDRDAEVQEAAVTALGRIGGPEARRALEHYLDTDDDALRDAVDSALAELEFTDAGADISLLVLDDEDFDSESLDFDEDEEDWEL
jgi:HEAT repeat protein